jgi:hypothetical protein
MAKYILGIDWQVLLKRSIVGAFGADYALRAWERSTSPGRRLREALRRLQEIPIARFFLPTRACRETVSSAM